MFTAMKLFLTNRLSGSYNRRSAGFSLLELLMSMVIVAMVGGFLVTAFKLMLISYRQTDDHITSRYEIEFAINAVRPEFSNISLGMPNGKYGSGSFSKSFGGTTYKPIMAYMGDGATSWGGPITLARGNAYNHSAAGLDNLVTSPVSGTDEYVGDVLFYAWAVPTGERIAYPENGVGLISGDTDINIAFQRAGAVDRLLNFQAEGHNIGIIAGGSNNGENLRSWLLLPSFRVPLFVKSVNSADNKISVKISPGAQEFSGVINGYEEVHLIQVGCVYARDGNLIRRVYETLGSYSEKSIATNISAVCFSFNDTSRILTMYVASFGNSFGDVDANMPADVFQSRWSPHMPINIRSADVGRRFLIESMTWRIKN